MDRDEGEPNCVACGYRIKYSQRGGFSSCGHGIIHYNCSYLMVNCIVCGVPLTYDVNQTENDYLEFQMNREETASENSDIYCMLQEIKDMLVDQKKEQAKQLKMIEDLKEEIKEYKSQETRIHELQTDIMQLKHEKVTKDIKDLQEKFDQLTTEINDQ